MRIARIILDTRTEGPGNRACVWVQGCSNRCEGCFAKDLWDRNGGTEMSTEELKQRIASVIDRIDGITLLGGEPFDQAGELAPVAEYAVSRGKNVIAFTGYVYEDLIESEDPGIRALLNATDLLGDGPFMADRVDYSKPLLGSSNQRWIHLTDRISAKDMENCRNRFEFRVGPDGKLRINGMGNIEKLKEYLRKVGQD